MDLSKTGKLLYYLRKEKRMTQKELADKLSISAKTVSKWECGNGFPDVTLVRELAEIFGVSSENILSGDLNQNSEVCGNMKRTKFYVCKECGSIITGMGEYEISCCGRKILPLESVKCDNEHCIDTEIIENDYYITFNHTMTKEHYISFVSYVRFDRVLTVKLYPEQNGEVRIPYMRGGRLYFYCNKHGLFEMDIDKKYIRN